MDEGLARDLAAHLSRTTGQTFSVGASGTTPFSDGRAVSIRIVAPGSVWDDRVANLDEVLRKHSWEGICYYDRLKRQFGRYAGACSLWVDKVCANDLAIKPGDSNDGRSREMADIQRRLYRKLPFKHIVNKKAVEGRFFGFAITGVAGGGPGGAWQRDVETGVLAPFDLYPIPQRYINFKVDGTACAITPYNFQGVPIPEEAIMRFLWGSNFTPWGEADAQYVALDLWYVQQVRQMKMQGVEIYGRPVPWVEVPESIIGDEYDALEAGLQKQYKHYVITRTTANKYTVTFPSQNIIANGNAGRSEQEIERYHYGAVYEVIFGVQMTGDKTGGSRALEETRLDVIADKTPPALQALATMWQQGYSNRIWRVNAPNVPESLYPIWEPAVTASFADAQLLGQIAKIMADFSANYITRTTAERELAMAGVPSEWIHDMTESTEKERESLDAPVRIPQPGDNPNPQEQRNAA